MERTDRPSSIRPKMSREDRAKQFMPFAAVRGLEEALRKKELEIQENLRYTPEEQGETL